MKFLLMAMVVVSGMTIPVQIAANKRLDQALKSPVLPVAMTLLIGAAVAWLIVGLVPAARGEIGGARAAPWWAWVGGFLIVYAITTQILNARQEGAGAVIALVVAGQLAAALVIDHFGWLGMKREAINWWKVLGAVLLVAGAWLMQVKK
ncbi:MAG TPA: DMT family transporter [Tepidisphaeraceae bacterium]|nr:DMT family transporter [Tepidisphaeraceae bacterium]